MGRPGSPRRRRQSALRTIPVSSSPSLDIVVSVNRLPHTYPRRILPVNLFFWETTLLPATIWRDGWRCFGVLHGPERRLRRALPGIRGPAGPLRQAPRVGAGSPCRRRRLRFRGAASPLRLRRGGGRGLRPRSGPVPPRPRGDRGVLGHLPHRPPAGRPRPLSWQLAGPRTPGRGGTLSPGRRLGHLEGRGDPPPDPQLRAPAARERYNASPRECGGGGDRVPSELCVGGEPEGPVPDDAPDFPRRRAQDREKRHPSLPPLPR